MSNNYKDSDPQETQEWLDSIDDALEEHGYDRARFLLEELIDYAQAKGARLPFNTSTPFVNTILPEDEPEYPGNREIERRVKSYIRWNAMAMVVRANTSTPGIGGHISTYASAATLYEVAFNHFFKGPKHKNGSDLIFYQGHGSPGIYARSFLEGRFTKKNLENFRREMSPGGLSSYPHPYLMPDYWQFATVSMGLGPIMAIYQARFLNYMIDRGFITNTNRKVWAFLGDGEMDEPEAKGALTLATKEELDNLIFVVNCNLQRLDGPVRGNSKVIQELEGAFRGAGWNVIKVIWGSDWDDLIKKDDSGKLLQRMEEVVDGELLKYVVEGGAYFREHFFGKYEETLKLVEHISDDDLIKMKLGGHDPVKMYAAYKEATEHEGRPTVILARTIKGYGMGEAGEGRNITHNQKKLNEKELLYFRDRFDIDLSDEKAITAPFVKPSSNSPDIKYIKKQREELGGFLPKRVVANKKMKPISIKPFNELLIGTGDREISTTMAFVRFLTILCRDKEIGKNIVPIIPDEARTFGMDPLFRQLGIYSHKGQLYDPVDSDQFLYYKEAVNGQIFEEGINEAGAVSSFIAAGMSYHTTGENIVPIIPDEARTFGMDPLFRQLGIYSHKGQLYDPVDSDQFLYYKEAVNGQIFEEGINEAGAVSSFIAAGMSYHTTGENMVPFYIYYSMFGFQRIWDFVWAAGDMKVRGFLLGATAGRTTLNGEGLQHQDGHSHLAAAATPNVKAYDVAYAYEIPIIIQHGIKEMFYDQKDVIYYLTLENENYIHPKMPKNIEKDIIKGMYKIRTTKKPTIRLIGSGPLLREVIAAADLLINDWDINPGIWNVTSFTELRREAEEVERWNIINPSKKQKKSHLEMSLNKHNVPTIAVSDYVKMSSEQIAPYVSGSYYALGTDGFGRSDTRENLRHFFEVDRYYIVLTAIRSLVEEGVVKMSVANKVIKKYNIDSNKPSPVNI